MNCLMTLQWRNGVQEIINPNLRFFKIYSQTAIAIQFAIAVCLNQWQI